MNDVSHKPHLPNPWKQPPSNVTAFVGYCDGEYGCGLYKMQSSSKTMPPQSPACAIARHALTCAANAPCKARLCSKLMCPKFQCASMCDGTASGQTPSMTMYFEGKFMFDKRVSPMLSFSEITKYGKPKPGGGGGDSLHMYAGGGYAGCAGRHADEPEESADMGSPASMPGGPVIGAMPRDAGHCAIAGAFRFDLFLHIKASSGVARAHSASSAVCALRTAAGSRSMNRRTASCNSLKRSLSVEGDCMCRSDCNDACHS